MYRIAAEDMAAVVAKIYHQTVLLALLAVRSGKNVMPIQWIYAAVAPTPKAFSLYRPHSPFIRVFTSGHLGRQVEEMPSKLDGCVTLVCTYGSSDYSVQQMSQFIDNLLQDCAALGIETPEETRINSLLEEWDKR